MIVIEDFVSDFTDSFIKYKSHLPWEIISNISDILLEMLQLSNKGFVVEKGIAIHKSAKVHSTSILNAPVIINDNCFIGAHSILRAGVYLGKGSTIGVGCEIKSSIIMNKSNAAHYNFIGDSIIGSNVNFEAGAVIANHFNERSDKLIKVLYKNSIINTNTNKFGALVGDNCRIGANAVLSPGTILPINSIIKRLELVQQMI
jgi:NDP-sugar pyrophosphorylase family protein